MSRFVGMLLVLGGLLAGLVAAVRRVLPGGRLARAGGSTRSLNSLTGSGASTARAVYYGASVANVLTLLLVVMMISGSLLTTAERKWSAMIQNRIGANRIRVVRRPRLGGIPFLAADALKMLTKERVEPRGPHAGPVRARAGAGVRAGLRALRHRAGRPGHRR